MWYLGPGKAGALSVAEFAPKSAMLPYWTAWEPQIAVGV